MFDSHLASVDACVQVRNEEDETLMSTSLNEEETIEINGSVAKSAKYVDNTLLHDTNLHSLVLCFTKSVEH